MARLRDVPVVLGSVGLVPFAKRVWGQVSEDSLLTWAAALAYSWLFAVFPFLIFVLALVPYLPERMKESTEAGIKTMVRQSLPKQANSEILPNIETSVEGLVDQPRGALLYLGIIAAVWAASGGMAMTMSAMDRCYELKTARPWWKQRLLALGLTLAAALLILAVVVLLPIGTAVRDWVTSPKHQYIHPNNRLLIVFNVLRWALAVVFMITLLMLIYHFGPAVKHHLRWITPGAVFSIVVWVLLGLLFRLYVERFGNYDKTYGTVGGVAILLLFFYVDAVVLLIGAEINSEIDFEVLKVRRGTSDFRPAEQEEEQQDAAPAAGNA